jgi:flagellar motor protein MotB
MPDEFPDTAVRSRANLSPIPIAPAPDRNRPSAPPPPEQPFPEQYRSEADRKKIEELNRTIQNLEHQLAESKRNEEQLKAAAAVVSPPPGTAADTAADPAPKLPVINKPGVTVYADAQRQTHIEIMDKVLFMPNTWQLTSEGEEVLRSIGAEIKAFAPNSIVAVEGHTDSLAGDPANRIQKHDVSSIKAMAVMEFFVNTLRWNAAAVETRSCGLSRPVADNATPEGRARNNRIELVIRNVL